MTAQPIEWQPSVDDFKTVVDGEARSCAAVYGAQLENGPVTWTRMPGTETCAWAVLGADELRHVLQDYGTFTSAVPHIGDVPMPPIETDPPLHTRYRRVLNRYFTGERVAALQPDIEGFTVELLEPLLAAGGGAVLESLRTLPIRTLCRVLGLPDEHWSTVLDAVAGFQAAVAIETFHDPALAEERMAHIGSGMALAEELIEQRQREPRDDLISGIATAEFEGQLLFDRQDAVGQIVLLLLAGFETTWIALQVATYLLATDAELQSALRDDPGRIPDAVEEMLRYQAPVTNLDRTATRDVELGGRQIAAGDKLLVFFSAANLDPAGFESPSELRTDRTPNRHFSFGHGVHKCVGAPLARLELQTFVRELLARTSSFEVDGLVGRKPFPSLAFDRLDLRMNRA